MGSVRSYAYGLLRWWRWLVAIGVDWDKATSAEVKDFVLWLGRAAKPRNSPRTRSIVTVGTVNATTRKRYLGDQYEPWTVRRGNAVLRSFYEFWIELGAGPLVNPVVLDRRGRRPNTHHNPLEPFRAEGRVRYNPKVPQRKPRAMPDERWNELFAGLRSNRDRAILALGISNGARASELLGVRGADLDWGEQLVRVCRKGTGVEQWLPASPEVFVWIRLYLAELDALEPNDPLWWTLRRRDHGDGLRRQPMNYEALRAVFKRVNALLGTNYSMHDLRHTAALRMSRDGTVRLTGWGVAGAVLAQVWLRWCLGQAVVDRPTTWFQVVNRMAISRWYSLACSRWRRGRKCGDIPLNADRNRCAPPGEVNFFIARSRCRVG
jgi:integrase